MRQRAGETANDSEKVVRGGGMEGRKGGEEMQENECWNYPLRVRWQGKLGLCASEIGVDAFRFQNIIIHVFVAHLLGECFHNGINMFCSFYLRHAPSARWHLGRGVFQSRRYSLLVVYTGHYWCISRHHTNLFKRTWEADISPSCSLTIHCSPTFCLVTIFMRVKNKTGTGISRDWYSEATIREQ